MKTKKSTQPKRGWSAEDDNRIREGVAAGHAYAHIAEFILGGRRTRNSVIGRAHRLGIEHTMTKARRQKKLAPPPKPEPKPVAVVAPKPKPAPKPVAKPAPKPEPIGLGPTIIDLEYGQCKWPTAQDSAGIHRFCAKPVSEVGHPYCCEHRARSGSPSR